MPMWEGMAAISLPSPGLSCGSPYSDVTSGSLCSDSYEPLSPEINFETLHARYSVNASVNELPSSCDKDSGKRAITAQDVQFYRELQVGTDESIQLHFKYVMAKINSGEYVFLEPENPNSSTPYSDVAQPKKRSKDGAVRRPMNAFMAFSKCERHILAFAKTSIHNAVISRHLGKVWRLFPNEGKSLFKVYANSLKQWHQQEYPGYKYRPQKKKSADTGRSTGEGKPKAVPKTPKPRNRTRKGSATSFQPLVEPKAEQAANCSPLYVDLGAVKQDPLYGSTSPLLPQEQTIAVCLLPSYPSDVAGLQPEQAYVEDCAVKQERVYAENAVLPEQQDSRLLTVQQMGATESAPLLHRSEQVPMDTDTVSEEPPHGDLSDIPDWGSMDINSMLTSMDCDNCGFDLPTEDLVQGNEVMQALETDYDLGPFLNNFNMLQ